VEPQRPGSRLQALAPPNLRPTPRVALKWSGCASLTRRRSKPFCLVHKAWSPSIAAGAIVVDSSTISPIPEHQFAERLLAKGVDYVDAPVTGSKVAAEAGSLIFMAGGDEGRFLAKLDPPL